MRATLGNFRLVALLAASLVVAGIAPAAGDSVADDPSLTVELTDFYCLYGVISPTSEHWVCTQSIDGVIGDELYSIPLDGSRPALRLSPDLGTDEDHVSWFEVTADGEYVIFAHGAAHDWDILDRSLYKVPIDGGPVTALTPHVQPGELLWRPDLAPDGSRLAYFWYPETGGGGLYTLKLDGTGIVELNPPVDPRFVLTYDEAFLPEWDWDVFTPDSNWVYYHTAPGDVYTAPVTGGVPVKVTGLNPAGGDVHKVWFTPDSSRLVYLADHDTVGINEIYAAPVGGGSFTKLNRALTSGEYVDDLVALLPDSSGVVYGVTDPGSGSSVPVWHLASFDGGPSSEISDGIEYVLPTSDSSAVVMASPNVTVHPLDGGDPIILGDPGTAHLAPDSALVWMWQDPESDGTRELYTVPIDGGTPVAKPGASVPSVTFLGSGARVFLSPDSRWLVYRYDTELWAVPRDGDGTAFQISDDVVAIPNEFSAVGIAISPDSTRVVHTSQSGVYSTLLTRHPEADDVTWTVPEDSPVGTSIGVLTATDPDGDNLSFAISSGGTPFEIDSATGEVSLIAPLDAEAHQSHEFGVDIADGLTTRAVVVTVNVTNVNDNAPSIDDLTVSVAEDAPVGTVLGQLIATDADGDNPTLSVVETNPLFNVAPNGNVTVTAALDFETTASHSFDVEATDGLFTDTATVTVNVTDVDETPPTSTTTTTTTLPPPDFGDVPDDNVFLDDITWLATRGITKGCNPPANDHFCPADYVTRGQMAAFLHRALGEPLTPGPGIEFIDDDTSGFESDIEWLASVGVTRGCNPPTNDHFCPSGFVTRGQMAAFLDRAIDLPDPPIPDLFTDDDGSLFEEQIDRLATAGITRGCNPPVNTLFCPDAYVTREQMAAFLHRAFGSQPTIARLCGDTPEIEYHRMVRGAAASWECALTGAMVPG